MKSITQLTLITYIREWMISISFFQTGEMPCSMLKCIPCVLLNVTLTADNDKDITAGVIPVNNFFAHLIKEIRWQKIWKWHTIFYRTNMVNIYRHSNEHLKHMQKKAWKAIEAMVYYLVKRKLKFMVMMTDALTTQQWTQQLEMELMKTSQKDQKNFQNQFISMFTEFL